jgi:thiol-disulfide isomerase/thioredoxin
MKKFLNIVLVFVFTILLVPTFVLAEGEDKNEEVKKAPIQIYEFYGSSCGYCAALNSWFESIEKDYGDYFDLVKYEVWGSEKNNALMNGYVRPPLNQRDKRSKLVQLIKKYIK